MILVFSIGNDASTQLVLEWLQQQGMPFVFVNETQPITQYKVDITSKGIDMCFEVNGQVIRDKDITAVWYRRNALQFPVAMPDSLPGIFKQQFLGFVKYEGEDFRQFFYSQLEGLMRINKASDGQINKLLVLQEAVQLGMLVPDTKLFAGAPDHDLIEYIIKPIHNGLTFYYEDYMCRLLTQPYAQGTANHFPTLVQKRISKQFEVRCFYLYGELFSIAMFTQQHKNTLVDYRNYDFSKPARCVPFQLPKGLAVKVRKLMQRLSLQSGSIDFIYSANHELYFLEVNPIGQFGNVSHYGNYYIEKRIATILANEKRKNTTVY